MYELPKITSRDNQRLVQARKVRDGHASGRIFIEGKRLSIEALRSEMDISECFVSERITSSSENASLVQQISETTQYVFEVPERIFRTIAATENSQGVILIAERPADSAAEIVRVIKAGTALPIVLYLFRISNPSNLGAIIRTAEASGIAGIVVSRNSADVFSPKALRASMGASFRMPIWTDAEFPIVLDWARRAELVTTATGALFARKYTDVDLRIPRLIIFGSEAHGLSENELESVSERLQIPMDNGVESLNLAVAAGIILFEAKRQSEI